MDLVTVTALRDFSYQGKAITAGAVLHMRPIDASVYVRRHLVSASRHPGLNRSSLQPDPEPEPEPLKPTRRGRYRRRDLVADEP